MIENDLDYLEGLVKKASPGPWFVRHLDDEHCMSAVTISTVPPSNDGELSMRAGNWPTEEIIAATLIQQPRYVDSHDSLWNENAELITALRNTAVELIKLARTGIAKGD